MGAASPKALGRTVRHGGAPHGPPPLPIFLDYDRSPDDLQTHWLHQYPPTAAAAGGAPPTTPLFFRITNGVPRRNDTPFAWVHLDLQWMAIF